PHKELSAMIAARTRKINTDSTTVKSSASHYLLTGDSAETSAEKLTPPTVSISPAITQQMRRRTEQLQALQTWAEAQHEICELEALIADHNVSERQAEQLRLYFSISPYSATHRNWLRRSYRTTDGVCLVTRRTFAEAVNWMAHCDRCGGGARR
ncbi:MAG: hypothetical protein ACK526_01010, partial [Planctomyces sp.]